MTTLSIIAALLIAFQIKHFLADYPLQTPYMLQKFAKIGWVLPLSAHAGVHALFTYLISLFFLASVTGGFYAFYSIGLAAFDFAIHFTMDRIKASPELMGRWKAVSAVEYKSLTMGALQIDAGDSEARLFAKSCVQKLKANTYFWWALGFDQAVHHLTHYTIIFFILKLLAN